MIVKTILVKKHSFGSFEVDSIGPVSETANDIRLEPNIQGQIGWLSSYGITSNVENSALYWGKPNAGTTRTQQISGESSLDVYLDASRNNPLFGASETVQPAGLFAQCLIRYA